MNLIFNDFCLLWIRLRRIFVWLGVVAFVGIGTSAQAVVINFDPLGTSDGLNHTLEEILPGPPDTTEGGTLYSESGFTLKSTGLDKFSIHGIDEALDGSGTGFVGSVAMFNSVENGVGNTRLTKDSPGSFNLNSIDIFANQLTPGDISVEFLGTKSNNDIVSKLFTFNHNGSDFSAKNVDFEFDNFTDLVSVTWINAVNGIGVHQFDNIDVTEFIDQGDPDPVPEPGAMAIFAIGLLGLGILARRRR